MPYTYGDRYRCHRTDEYLSEGEVECLYIEAINDESDYVNILVPGTMDVEMEAAAFVEEYLPKLYTEGWEKFLEGYDFIEASEVPRREFIDPDAARDARMDA